MDSVLMAQEEVLSTTRSVPQLDPGPDTGPDTHGGWTGPLMLSSSLYRVPSAPASGPGLCQSHLPQSNVLALVPNLQLTSH